MLGTLKRAWGKPPGVIAFRTVQHLRMAGLRATGGLDRLQRRALEHWSGPAIAHVFAADQPHITAPDAIDALRALPRREVIEPALGRATCIMSRQFEVLNARVPEDGAWPWDTDWRFSHRWPAVFIGSYDFHEPRTIPYDVKYPWELSRLAFLQHSVQAAALGGSNTSLEWSMRVIEDWARHNRLGYSIGWHPMEVSMRLLSLLILSEMMYRCGGTRRPGLSRLLGLAAAHGEFLWRNIEYTDVRGNHYMANLTALLVAGLRLRAGYPPARAWAEHARLRLPKEVRLQILPDGVDFEKSLPYHRLVVELLLLARITLIRAGESTAALDERLLPALRYMADSRRPDHLLPNVGDNDGACLLEMDGLSNRDPEPLLQIGCDLYPGAQLKEPDRPPTLALAWLLGREGIERWRDHPCRSNEHVTWYSEGRVLTARAAGRAFWLDVGEVGLAGRGGHGHNDLFSFEYCDGGRAVIVDPGCPVYTGDPDLRNTFRSTAYHNTLRVDGEELARMPRLFRILDDAKPTVEALEIVPGGSVTLQASHDGYTRLLEPVVHRSLFELSSNDWSVRITDSLQGKGRHFVERHFHLAPGVEAELLDGSAARLRAGANEWTVGWNSDLEGRLERRYFSSAYGHIQDSWALVVAGWITPGHATTFSILRAA